MAEYLSNPVQTVLLNNPIIFTSSLPCTRGFVYHEDETGNFILRGIVNNACANFNGEPRLTSRAIVTPAAVEEYNNVTSTAIITVPKGCCFNVAVRAVAGADDAETASIEVQNANLVINRIA